MVNSAWGRAPGGGETSWKAVELQLRQGADTCSVGRRRLPSQYRFEFAWHM